MTKRGSRLRYTVAGTATAALLLLTGTAGAMTPGADPAINHPFRGPDYRSWVGILERPGRELYDRRDEVVRALNLRTGMRVADIGAGTGLYTRLFARAVGAEGRVYAVDIAESFVSNIQREARVQGLQNIVGVVNSQTGTGLPDGSVDLAFLADTYHHFERPADMLASIYRALRPAGELVIIDFHRDPAVSSSWVMQHTRAGRDEVRQEVELAGFRYTGEETFLRGNFFLRFRKP
jgi:predicted methyltransferase